MARADNPSPRGGGRHRGRSRGRGGRGGRGGGGRSSNRANGAHLQRRAAQDEALIVGLQASPEFFFKLKDAGEP
jgi:hypothetical protein